MVTFVMRVASTAFFSDVPSIIETALAPMHYPSCTPPDQPQPIAEFIS